MKLNQNEYKLIEITEDEEYGMVIGNIVTQDDKFNYAEIIGGTICDYRELENIRTFLNKIEKVMNRLIFKVLIGYLYKDDIHVKVRRN